jgi:hypothetical protein
VNGKLEKKGGGVSPCHERLVHIASIFLTLHKRLCVNVTDSLVEDEGELLFLFDTSSHKVFREENHPFRRNAWTFMKFIPGLHTTWHMCVFHVQYTLTNDVLHITLCVDIISFLLEFSFEFI